MEWTLYFWLVPPHSSTTIPLWTTITAAVLMVSAWFRACCSFLADQPQPRFSGLSEVFQEYPG